MDIQSIINSGILEKYALGHCTEAEAAEVQRLLVRHPALRTELEGIEKALEDYARAHAAEPPAWMKGRILERAAAETGLPGRIPGKLRLFQTVAAGLAFCLVLVSYGLWTNANIADASRKALVDCESQNRTADTLRQHIAFLRDPDTQQILVKGEAGTGYFFLNTRTGQVYVDVASLPQPPAGKYYQCWGIVAQTPVSLGMADWNSTQGLQYLGTLPDSGAFAISTEDNPRGNPAPSKVYLIGNAG